jgi:hypothetical protein
MSHSRLEHAVVAKAEEATGYLGIGAIENLGLVVTIRHEEQAARLGRAH